WRALGWVWKKLVMLVIHFEVYNMFRLEWIIASSDYSDYGDYPAEESIPIPSKTRPRPCDMEIDLYEMQPMEPEPIKGKLSKCSDRSCDKRWRVLVPCKRPPTQGGLASGVQAVHSPVGALEQPGDAGGVYGLQLLQPARTPAAQGGGARRGHLLQPELSAPHAPRRLHQLPRRRSGTETTVWPRPYPPGIRQPAAFSVVTACNLLVLLLGMNRRLLADLPPTHDGRPAGLPPNRPRCFKVRDDRDPGIVPSLCASDCFCGTPHR
ncbi:unnamed protein product, partial [Ixodes pacificus]